MSYDVTELGRRRANPQACPTNFVRFARVTDGCCTEEPTCEDVLSATIPATESLVSFELNGVTQVLPTPVIVTDVAGMQSAIEEILGTNLDCQEFNVWVNVEYTGGVLTITHRGACVMTNFQTDAAKGSTDTRTCTTLQYCNYSGIFVGAVANLNINGTSYALATGTYNYAGDTVTDDATAAQLQADAEAAVIASGINYNSVVAARNDSLGVFDLTINAEIGTVILNGTNKMQRGQCRKQFG